jgi:DeoR family transcriptional regulator, fructose operon transcriptional repressor
MSKENSSLKIDRFKKILNTVNSNKRISLAHLEKILDVSRITIQRDLVELENRKLIRRFHGGAMSLEFSDTIYSYDQHKNVNVAEKKTIAEKAVALIKEGQYIGLDSSSTVYYITEMIIPRNVFVLTSNISAFNNLITREDIQVMLAGGRLNKQTRTLVGPELIDLIRKIHFDIVFISAEACIPVLGFFDPYAEEVQVKQALMESSNATVALVDSSKMTKTNGIRICGVEEIDYVITDKPTDKSLKSIFKDKLL